MGKAFSDNMEFLLLFIITISVLFASGLLTRVVRPLSLLGNDQLSPTYGESQLKLVSAKPLSYYGQEITIAGEVSRVLSDNTLLLEPVSDTQAPILIVSLQSLELLPIDPKDIKGKKIRATGIVEELKPETVSETTGVDVHENEVNKYRGKPYLIARRVALVQ